MHLRPEGAADIVRLCPTPTELYEGCIYKPFRPPPGYNLRLPLLQVRKQQPRSLGEKPQQRGRMPDMHFLDTSLTRCSVVSKLHIITF